MSNDHLHLPVELKLRIDWSELDLFGHVNNVAILKYVQAARVNYWELIGLMEQYETAQIGPMLASTSCEFRRPLFYPGDIIVRTGIESIGNTSFVLKHIILNENGEPAAEARDVVVVYDFVNGRKSPFSNELREAAERVEKRKL